MNQMEVSVCGCSLVDYLYTNINFDAPELRPFLSRRSGDGGLVPGQLVFAEDLETFAGMSYDRIREVFSKGKEPDVRNLGGPAIVGAVAAAQILYDRNIRFNFYGSAGNDEGGRFISEILKNTPLNTDCYRFCEDGATPSTDVLSDPSFHHGKGERLFINRIGAAGGFGPGDLDDRFFKSAVTWYAATALVPRLHENLTALLYRSRQEGALNIVSTVYDFKNEKTAPDQAWPLGESAESYRLIDLLIVDFEEALRLSGTRRIEDACAFFRSSGVSSFFITHGAKNFYAWSDGRLFRPVENVLSLPVSALVDEDLAAHPEWRGDTTGCGDNFAGGLVSSFIRQLSDTVPAGHLDLIDAAAWAAACGGSACFHVGGTRIDKIPGEKYKIVRRYAEAYPKQLV